MPSARNHENLRAQSAARPGVSLLDAHVHIHECFELPAFLQHARANFRAQAARSGHERAFDGVLMLTESAGCDRFADLQRGAKSSPGHLDGWTVSATDELISLRLADAGGESLFVVRGRQVVTSERLEVLALGMADSVRDGLPIQDVIERVQRAGAICVLPWGFGKWTGRRGKIIRQLIGEDLGSNLFLGDNAGRLGLWSRPREFGTADRRGISILPGTDPLPWPEQIASVAAFGGILDCRVDEKRPFDSLHRYLVEERGSVESYGKLERLLPFVRHQVGMQLRKFVK